MEPGILTFCYKSRNVAGDDDLPLQGQWSHIKKTKRESSRTGSQWYCILVPRSVSEWWSHFWGEAIFEVGRRFLSTLVGETPTPCIFLHVFFCKAWGESDLPKILFHGKSEPPPPPRPRNATYTVHCHVIPFPVRLVAMVVGPFKGMYVCFRALYTTCQKPPSTKLRA